MNQSSVPRLPLHELRESPTNPRTIFTGLDELAATIRTSGVVQALIVRPLTKPEKKVTHEIVAGARRFRASQLAGMSDVPVDIRTLTDEEALDIQQIENLQREDLKPLEEAKGFLAMLSRTGSSMDALAAKLGKTAKHIAARLSLLNLVEEARQALDEDRIGIPHALKIAPLPKAVQPQALEACFSEHWDRGPIQALLPVAQLEAWIQRMVLRTLKSVPFDKSADDLVPNVGSCDNCQERTGAKALLFPDCDGDSCLDEACLKAKIEAHVQRSVTANPELVQISTAAYATRKDGPVGVKDYINIVEPQKKPRSGTDPARIKCDHAREAIVTDGHDRGAKRLVCADPACTVHHAKAQERTDAAADQRQQTRDEEREKRLKMATRRAIGDAILAKFKQPTAADWQLIAGSSARHIPHEYRIDLAKRMGIPSRNSLAARRFWRLLRRTSPSSIRPAVCACFSTSRFFPISAASGPRVPMRISRRSRRGSRSTPPRSPRTFERRQSRLGKRLAGNRRKGRPKGRPTIAPLAGHSTLSHTGTGMPALKDPLAVNALNFDDPAEMAEFDSAWMAASIERNAPVLAQMRRDGIIDEHGRRVSTTVPVVDAEASVEQQ